MYNVTVPAFVPGACIILGGFLVMLTQFIVVKVQDYHSQKYIDACELARQKVQDATELARYRAGLSKFDG